jgi:2-methylcitrate dehydratase PrpD
MTRHDSSELHALGGFVSQLRYEGLPAGTVGLAKLAILNILGGIVVSDHPTLNPGRAALLRYARKTGGAPRASIVGTLERTSAELAALVTSGSAMMAHGDDWSWPARTHLSSVVFPATLAMAEAEGRSGRDLIAGFVAGWEVAVRVGAAIVPVPDRKSPFTSPVHGLATSAVAANLMRLDATTAACALSIATDMGTGNLAQAPKQHVVLRTPLGGSLGIYAAGIAAEGIEGRLDVLPSFCGIYGDYDPRPLREGLGREFRFEQSGFLPKVFHFSTGIYPTIYGIQRHQNARRIEPGEITEIRCEASPAIRTVYGAAPAESREMTHFSLRLGIALALCGSEFRYEEVATLPNPDPQVRRLAELVELVPAPGLESELNLGASAEATVTRLRLRDGSGIVIASDPYPPVLDAQRDAARIEALFMRRVAPRWGDARAAAIRNAVDNLDRSPTLDALVASLTPAE